MPAYLDDQSAIIDDDSFQSSGWRYRPTLATLPGGLGVGVIDSVNEEEQSRVIRQLGGEITYIQSAKDAAKSSLAVTQKMKIDRINNIGAESAKLKKLRSLAQTEKLTGDDKKYYEAATVDTSYSKSTVGNGLYQPVKRVKSRFDQELAQIDASDPHNWDISSVNIQRKIYGNLFREYDISGAKGTDVMQLLSTKLNKLSPGGHFQTYFDNHVKLIKGKKYSSVDASSALDDRSANDSASVISAISSSKHSMSSTLTTLTSSVSNDRETYERAPRHPHCPSPTEQPTNDDREPVSSNNRQVSQSVRQTVSKRQADTKPRVIPVNSLGPIGAVGAAAFAASSPKTPSNPTTLSTPTTLSISTTPSIPTTLSISTTPSVHAEKPQSLSEAHRSPNPNPSPSPCPSPSPSPGPSPSPCLHMSDASSALTSTPTPAQSSVQPTLTNDQHTLTNGQPTPAQSSVQPTLTNGQHTLTNGQPTPAQSSVKPPLNVSDWAMREVRHSPLSLTDLLTHAHLIRTAHLLILNYLRTH